jgi:hypothetical protein
VLQEWPPEERARLGARHALARRVRARVERWTYDFGKSAFVQRVTLVNGKVAGIEPGSRSSKR